MSFRKAIFLGAVWTILLAAALGLIAIMIAVAICELGQPADSSPDVTLSRLEYRAGDFGATERKHERCAGLGVDRRSTALAHA